MFLEVSQPCKDGGEIQLGSVSGSCEKLLVFVFSQGVLRCFCTRTTLWTNFLLYSLVHFQVITLSMSLL